jgi:hypothetical protein
LPDPEKEKSQILDISCFKKAKFPMGKNKIKAKLAIKICQNISNKF